MKTGVVAIKVNRDKDGIKTAMSQSGQIATACVKNDIKIVDCIPTFIGAADIIKEVKKIDRKRRFDYLLIYSPNQIAKNAQEYKEFVSILKHDFQIEVIYLRAL